MALLVGALGVAPVAPAWALQPVATFLGGADERNPDNREGAATLAQRDAEATAALGRLLPALTVRGVYTRNEFEVSFPLGPGKTLTIQPRNQVDAFFQLDVPVVDLGSYGRYRAQRAMTDLARESRGLTRLEIRKAVVRVYYQLLGVEGLVASAGRSVEAAQKNAEVVRNRREGGVASDFDVARAAANVERAQQDVADAELAAGLARRALETLTGVTPEPASSQATDDLREEAPLATWLGTPGADLPAGRVGVAQSRAAEASRDAARLALVPTVSASAMERVSNAQSFGGEHAYYTLSANITSRFDFSMLANIRAQDAAAVAARARAEKTARASEDEIYEAWLRVRTGIAKSRAARAQAAAADEAARLAEVRYAGGAATQLDVVQAQRDAFGAAAALAMADADLRAARAILRLSAARPLTDIESRVP